MSKAGAVRPTAAVAMAIVTREGKPVYLKALSETENELKYHFILHAALDHFEEKQAVEKGSYLGNFAVIEDYRLFGFVANSGVRIVLCTDDGDPVSKANMKAYFEAIQQAYIDYAASPFVEEGTTIVSRNFEARIERVTEQVFGSTV